MAQQLCQAVHAAHEAGIHLGNSDRISSVVICAVPNEQALQLAASRLDYNSDIRYTLFREPDLGDQATALATEPIDDRRRRRFMSRYKLWE